MTPDVRCRGEPIHNRNGLPRWTASASHGPNSTYVDLTVNPVGTSMTMTEVLDTEPRQMTCDGPQSVKIKPLNNRSNSFHVKLAPSDQCHDRATCWLTGPLSLPGADDLHAPNEVVADSRRSSVAVIAQTGRRRVPLPSGHQRLRYSTVELSRSRRRQIATTRRAGDGRGGSSHRRHSVIGCRGSASSTESSSTCTGLTMRRRTFMRSTPVRRHRSLSTAAGVLAGSLPRTAAKLVREWTELRRAELLEDWRRAQAREELLPIEGLQ
jgi:hypothetical protein